MYTTFRTFYGAWQWLTTPWALPLIGALAAVLAALTVEPLSWLRAPVRAVGRAVVVAIVWMLAVWVLQKATGFGEGPGGPGGGGQPTQPATEVKMISTLPSGLSPERLAIQFLPSSGDPMKAKEYCCELVGPGSTVQDKPKVVTLRETSMSAFKERLAAALREHASREDNSPWPSATIAQQPFPGEPAIFIVVGCVKATFPGITIERLVQEGGDLK